MTATDVSIEKSATFFYRDYGEQAFKGHAILLVNVFVHGLLY